VGEMKASFETIDGRYREGVGPLGPLIPP
jgi:hypothetical protein